jgi:hypothetical protein
MRFYNKINRVEMKMKKCRKDKITLQKITSTKLIQKNILRKKKVEKVIK